jgi:hypothetical protein
VLLHVEENCRTVKGYKSIPEVIEHIKREQYQEIERPAA